MTKPVSVVSSRLSLAGGALTAPSRFANSRARSAPDTGNVIYIKLYFKNIYYILIVPYSYNNNYCKCN